MNANTKKVLKYLQEVDTPVKADDIVAETGLTSHQVAGIISMGLAKQKYAERVTKTFQHDDGTLEVGKFIILTDAGRAYDLSTVEG